MYTHINNLNLLALKANLLGERISVFKITYNDIILCNRFSFRIFEFYNKADDESSNKKHLDLYYILISQKLSIF